MKRNNKAKENYEEAINSSFVDHKMWLDSESNVTENRLREINDSSVNNAKSTIFMDNEYEMNSENDYHTTYVDLIQKGAVNELDDYFDQNRNIIKAKEKAIFVYFTVLYNGEEFYEKTNHFFDEMAKNLYDREALEIYESPESYDELLHEGEERNMLRNAAFKEAMNGGHTCALEKILEKDAPNIQITKEELNKMYKVDLSCCMAALKHNVRIQRPKSSAFKIIIGYLEEKNQLDQKHRDENFLNVCDILGVMLENDADNKEVSAFLSKFDIGNYFQEVISVLIMNGRYSMTQNLLEFSSKGYNPVYTNIAMENDQR